MQTPKVWDWKVIENKYNSSTVTQYIQIWEDYDVPKSYDNYNNTPDIKRDGIDEKGNKTAKLRNKYKRIKDAVEIIKKVGEWEAMTTKPENIEEYEAWKINLTDKSYLAAEKTFKKFCRMGVMPEKVSKVEKLNITTLLKCWKDSKKIINV